MWPQTGWLVEREREDEKGDEEEEVDANLQPIRLGVIQPSL